jgi:predicted metal-dependent enzyme (double-stranded beta helix superfamily)
MKEAAMKRTLTWRAFLDTVAGMTAEELGEERLLEMVGRLVIDAALLAPFIQFKTTGYARNVLFRDKKFEAICLCWEPGQGTAIHNHGRSFGVVQVYEGTLVSQSFLRTDDGRVPGRAELRPLSFASLPEGALTLDRVGNIHEIFNPADSGRRAVSLHFYAGPLDLMETFDLAKQSVTLKPMQAEPMAYIEPEAHVMAAMI